MLPQPIESKVEGLEHRVTQLEQLPARIDDLTLQVSQLRTEMRVEFSAVRSEIADQGASLLREMGEQGASVIATLGGQMVDLGKTLRQEIGEQGERFCGEFRTEIGNLETHMRVLHEDVISRIAQLQEGWSRAPKRKRK